MKKILKTVLKKPERGCSHYYVKLDFHLLYIVSLIMILVLYVIFSIEIENAFHYIFHYIMFTILATLMLKFEEIIEFMKELRITKGNKIFTKCCLIFLVLFISLYIITQNI